MKEINRFIDFGCNPILGNEVFIADVEARVFNDTLFLYGTSDTEAVQIVSTNDMKSFTDYGIVFSADDVKWKKTEVIWAPDCVCRNGKYYLYYCLPTGECGVAISENPEGPFSDLGQIVGVDGIDPSVLIDDDGQAYIFFGQVDNISVAKLHENMTSIDSNSIAHPLNVKEFGYHEGISARKINGKYVLSYTDTSRHGNMPVCQGYAISDKPTGGFKYKGIIIDNFGCDRKTWNNHGSIELFKGKYYIFYHCATNEDNGKRQLFVEELKPDNENFFAEAEMTSSGPYTAITADGSIPASTACFLRGTVRKTYDEDLGCKMYLGSISEGDAAVYKYLNFNGENKLSVKIKADMDGRVELYVDGKYHGYVLFNASNDYRVFENDIKPISGIHMIELRFFGKADYYNANFVENVSMERFSFK